MHEGFALNIAVFRAIELLSCSGISLEIYRGRLKWCNRDRFFAQLMWRGSADLRPTPDQSCRFTQMFSPTISKS
jgi:hypothetical protein